MGYRNLQEKLDISYIYANHWKMNGLIMYRRFSFLSGAQFYNVCQGQQYALNFANEFMSKLNKMSNFDLIS